MIQPASYKTNVGNETALDSSHTYSIKIYTTRGNFVEETYLPPNPQSEVGPFYFSFDKQSFNYTYYYSSSDKGGGVAWEISERTSQYHYKNNLVFIVKFTNHGTKPIEISYLSYIMVVVPYDDYVESEYYFHILNNTSTSQSPVAYEDYSQIVPANPDNPDVGVSQIVKFGGTKPGISTLQRFPPHEASSGYNNERRYLYTVWIGIFWRWSGSSDYYGIYVPFTGIHVVP
jgi:hypothetical protein